MSFLLSAAINAGAALLGRRDEERQAREATDRANQASREAATLAFQRNRASADRANKWNVKQAAVAERRTDKNAAIARRFNAQQATKANRFTASQNDLAYQRSESRDLRNRDWALEDYATQREDFSNQFVDLRAAADKAGFNPLAVLGSQMVPMSGAGGLSSSSYGAGTGVGASAGFSAAAAPTASVPMAYGAEVHVQPLASNAGIVGAVAELGQELTGVNAVARQTEGLYRDLAQIELEQARSGVVVPTASPGNFPTISASGVPHLGRSAQPVAPVSVTGDVWTDPNGTEWNTGPMPSYWRNDDEGNLVEYVPTTHSSMMGYVDIPGTSAVGRVGMDPSGEVLTLGQAGNVAAQLAPQLAFDPAFRDSAAALGRQVHERFFGENVENVTPPLMFGQSEHITTSSLGPSPYEEQYERDRYRSVLSRY